MILSSPRDQHRDLETMTRDLRGMILKCPAKGSESGDGKEPEVPFASFAAVVRSTRRSSLGVSPTIEVSLFFVIAI